MSAEFTQARRNAGVEYTLDICQFVTEISYSEEQLQAFIDLVEGFVTSRDHSVSDIRRYNELAQAWYEPEGGVL